MKNYLLCICMLGAMSGCVSVTTTKAVDIKGREICIVENPHVRTDFRDAYERRIQAKGYSTKIITDPAACPTTTTYTATYGFHWGTYLATSELKIFNNGVMIGQAIYKAPYVSPEKHGRVENKIGAMVDELLP